MKIWHKYGCCIYPNAEVKRGFHIAHPVGIVIGRCIIGEDFTVYQNTSIGTKNPGGEAKSLTPVIGNHVTLFSGSMIFGGITVCDYARIGANALVIHDIIEPGLYAGTPAKQIKSDK